MKLSAKSYEKQKEILLNEKERLERKIKKLKKYPDLGSSTDDNIQETTEYESNIPLENEVESILKKVNTALLSIEKGTYGRCKKCRKAIEKNRLKIVPYADICLRCSLKKKK